jgi:hypothetical protein
VDLDMFSFQKIVGSNGLYAVLVGQVHAEYGAIQSPEPGTLVMVIGLVASLAVYGWKRRAAR